MYYHRIDEIEFKKIDFIYSVVLYLHVILITISNNII